MRHGNTVNANVSGGWNDLVSSGLGMPLKGQSAPSFEVIMGRMQLPCFDDGVENESWSSAHFLHDYKYLTDVFPHIHWTHNTAGDESGVVRWGFESWWARGHRNERFVQLPDFFLEQAAGLPLTHNIIETVDGMELIDLEPDAVVLFTIYRDATHANDTFSGKAAMIGVDTHYESDETLTSNRSAPFTKSGY